MDSLTANLILQNQNSALVEGEKSLNYPRTLLLLLLRCRDNPQLGGAQCGVVYVCNLVLD